MRTTDTIIIGGGQAGLAASHCLAAHGRDHIVLERGRIGERWRTETWDSLHLLTPNWMNALPGWSYAGPDQDGFMSAASFADHLARYAGSFDAPVHHGVSVEALRRREGRFDVVTDDGAWRCSSVVVATGWCDRAAVPAISGAIDRTIHQTVPAAYRNSGSLPAGGVLVVGASATGVQLADELRAAGRDVTLAVGSHSRMPRRYRGMDIFWWLDRIGVLDKTIDEMPAAEVARHEPSLQLVGRPDRRSLDLPSLQRAGVELVGRLTAARGRRARFAPDLAATVHAADARMARVLATIDHHIDRNGLRDEVLAPEPVARLDVPSAVQELDLRAAGIGTVIWATGHRRSHPWLQIPVLDTHGEIRQHRGVTPVPGLYVLGQRFQHHRSSNFIGGVGRDAAFVADHIAGADRVPHIPEPTPADPGDLRVHPT